VVLADNRFLLKLFRRIEPMVNPEYEIGRYLTERGFTRIPALLRALEYNRPGLEPGTLAVVQSAVTHQGSGWEYTIDELRRYFDRVAARRTPHRGDAAPAFPTHPGSHAPPPFFNSLEHWYLQGAATLGQRTAELHAVLASSTAPAFAPEPCDGAALHAIADRMAQHADGSLAMLEQRIATLNPQTRGEAEAVLARRAAVRSRFDGVRGLDRAGMLIRVHGDYHLGQVLRTEADFVILDFEGEPARSISERRAKQSPMKDIAGMVRSYSYAAYAALFAFTTHAPDHDARLQAWADTWQFWAADAFLGGYRSAVGDARFIPRGQAWVTLLCAFMLDKAFYELEYELNHRPDWLRIPLVGIQRLLA
jgi:maltose alpha-D-glucosyltransferase/alpha-amylase